MKVYTRTGDKGKTSLIGGKRVPKYHARIEAYGTVDELIAFIGLLRDQEVSKELKDYLIGIQDRLMTCAALLAVENDKDVTLPEIVSEDISSLENEIDRMHDELPALESFVLPGGHPVVSYCHIARNVCRRAERYALKIDPGGLDLAPVFKYLNRLSDYLFVLSRKLSKDLKALEIRWNPRIQK
ncbi:MAG: cob(I)yrinic acid a,c-diamide adenosyltransferase [Bacteroidales bacterium]|nr:MAG: cob(I)yrinic acid a,c-diamide adenosyltransferase [Bacteroidales bacterium]